MMSRQTLAGIMPPVTRFIGELSSFPTHTAAAYWFVNPMNHASRESCDVPVFPAAV